MDYISQMSAESQRLSSVPRTRGQRITLDILFDLGVGGGTRKSVLSGGIMCKSVGNGMERPNEGVCMAKIILLGGGQSHCGIMTDIAPSMVTFNGGQTLKVEIWK